MNKLLIAVSLLILSLFSLNGQSYEWVVDTTYHKAYTFTSNPILYNGIDSSTIVLNQSIKKIQPITAINFDNIESQGRLYDNNYKTLNTNRYIDVTFSSFKGRLPIIESSNNYISYYIEGDGTYLKDISKSKTI